MVSKRCCPSCQDLAEILDNIFELGQKYPRVYPGWAVTWSPVSLPPWLPASIGRVLTDRAERALFLRFHKIQELIQQKEIRKRFISATTDAPTETEGPSPKRQKPGLSQN